ncbi:MAG TPA: ABC transporter ATP-binding protein [Candidatus Elarobacter sp.]
MTATQPLLSVERLGIELRGPKRSVTKVLAGVDLVSDGGEIISLLGPNGAGKTTLLRALTRFLKPATGRILVRGRDLVHDRRLLSEIGFCPEGDRSIDMGLTGAENTRMYLARQGERYDRKAALALAERFGIASKFDAGVGTLSKGMRQKVCLVGPLLLRTPILLLDEPTVALDAETTRELGTLLLEARDGGRLIILATHELTFADAVSSRVAILSAGSLAAMVGRADLEQMAAFVACSIVVGGGTGALALDPPGWQVFPWDGGVALTRDNASDDEVAATIAEIIRAGYPIRSVSTDGTSFAAAYRRVLERDRVDAAQRTRTHQSVLCATA